MSQHARTLCEYVKNRRIHQAVELLNTLRSNSATQKDFAQAVGPFVDCLCSEPYVSQFQTYSLSLRSTWLMPIIDHLIKGSYEVRLPMRLLSFLSPTEGSEERMEACRCKLRESIDEVRVFAESL